MKITQKGYYKTKNGSIAQITSCSGRQAFGYIVFKGSKLFTPAWGQCWWESATGHFPVSPGHPAEEDLKIIELCTELPSEIAIELLEC